MGQIATKSWIYSNIKAVSGWSGNSQCPTKTNITSAGLRVTGTYSSDQLVQRDDISLSAFSFILYADMQTSKFSPWSYNFSGNYDSGSGSDKTYNTLFYHTVSTNLDKVHEVMVSASFPFDSGEHNKDNIVIVPSSNRNATISGTTITRYTSRIDISCWVTQVATEVDFGVTFTISDPNY